MATTPPASSASETEGQATARRFEELLAAGDRRRFSLVLYVTGLTPRSTQAILTIRHLCETDLKDRVDLEVIDLYQQPELARVQQIIAAPTLLRRLPLPMRRLVGDLTDRPRVLAGLGLVEHV